MILLFIYFYRHGLKLIRKSLAEIQEEAILEGPDKKLIVDGHEISVAYFRAGYTPNDYPSDVEVRQNNNYIYISLI